MEQITREEMIGLLGRVDKAMSHPYHDENAIQDVRRAIASLQAAEPVGYGLKGMLTKQWDGKSFVEKEDADSYEEAALLPLFALPCPPAKAQVPEFDKKLFDSECRESVAGALGFPRGGDYAWSYLLAQIKEAVAAAAMPTASPVPNNDKDGCTCQGCGIVYAADLIVPDEWWEKIKPEGKADGSGLLCPTCIMDRLVEKGWSAGHITSPAPEHSGDGNELVKVPEAER